MKIKIDVNKILVYLISLLIVLPYFSTNVGITIGSIKINVVDIFMFLYFFIYILKNKKNKGIHIKCTEITKWKYLVLLFILYIPLGLLNGAIISEQLRLIRNLFYIIFIYYFFMEKGKSVNYIFLIEVIAIVSSFDGIVSTYRLYDSYNWYKFYRANGDLNIFLFCFLIFEIWSMKRKDAIIGLFSCISLICCSFLSQERTQILFIIISIAITLLYRFLFLLYNIKTIKINIKKYFKLVLFVFIVIICIYFLLRINYVKNYINYYFTYRLADGNIFNNNNIKSDGSYNERIVQINSITNNESNFLLLILGRGTCAKYNSIIGETAIVDSSIIWIYKDLGIIGIIVLLYIYVGLFNNIKKIYIDKRLSLIAALMSILLFSLSNPSYLISASASFSFGLFSFVKNKISVENSNILYERNIYK